MEQYKKISQSFEDMEALIALVESRLEIDLAPTDLKKAVKNIAGVIMEKNSE